jgi:drug/metabolite transporter (DMT)-like permease
LTSKAEASGIVSLAVVSWAFPGMFVRFMPHLGIPTLVALRLTAALLLLAPIAFSPKFSAQTKQAIKSPACWALAGTMFVYYLVATPAFYYAPVGEIALLIASAPLFAVLIRFLLREKVHKNEMLGAALAIVGVAVMAYPSIHASKGQDNQWIGITLSLIAAICGAAFAVGNRRLHTRGDSPGAVSLVCLTFFFGLLFLPFVAFEPTAHLTSPSLLWVLPLGMFSTALPTVLVAAAAHKISAVVATLINPMCAVGANLVAAVALKETPRLLTIIGGALVIVAIVIAMNPAAKADENLEP